MYSTKLNYHNQRNLKRLDRVGPFLVITNKRLYHTGRPNKFVLINDFDNYVESVHGSQYAAVTNAQRQVR